MMLPTPTPFQPKQTAPEVCLSAPFSCNLAGEAHLRFTYMPDRVVITAEHFQTWLTSCQQETWDTWENVGDILIHQFYDTLLPKSIRLEVDVPTAGTAVSQRLSFTQTQPKL